MEILRRMHGVDFEMLYDLFEYIWTLSLLKKTKQQQQQEKEFNKKKTTKTKQKKKQNKKTTTWNSVGQLSSRQKHNDATILILSCILRHRGVQLILAYSWARPAILIAG